MGIEQDMPKCQHRQTVPLKKLISILETVTANGSNHQIFPFDKLSEPQRAQLIAGSGHSDIMKELAKINSSTSLGVDYYKALEDVRRKYDENFEVSFEWRESIPVTGSSARANIDVRYEIGDEIFFVECKYLEPYYLRVKPNRAAYTNPKRCPQDFDGKIWAELCWKINNLITDINNPLVHFDAPQICRHLMAIRRHWKENPNIYAGKKIVMQSMSWDMPESFMEKAEQFGLSRTDLKGINEKIHIEASECEKIINEVISSPELEWDCRFEVLHYNDQVSLDMIKESSAYDSFLCKYNI